jgi:hypothetical protein
MDQQLHNYWTHFHDVWRWENFTKIYRRRSWKSNRRNYHCTCLESNFPNIDQTEECWEESCREKWNTYAQHNLVWISCCSVSRASSCHFVFAVFDLEAEYIVTDLISVLPGNSSVNTVQHARIEEGVFSVSAVTPRSGGWWSRDMFFLWACPFLGSDGIRSVQRRVSSR